MSTFAKPTFNYLSYSAARPSYPQSLYNHILSYLTGPRTHCLDLGTGHGVVSRALAPSFTHVTAIDPSYGMLKQAKELTPHNMYTNVTYEYGTAETLPQSIASGTVDLIVAAQCAHWFDYSKAWPELHRVLRTGGVFALWGYGDIAFPRHPKAWQILRRYVSGVGTPLEEFWVDPGRSIIVGRYQAIVPPDEQWCDVRRIEYVPGTSGLKSGQGTLLMNGQWEVGALEAYFRTWSAVHRWQEANPDAKARAEGGREGDVIDKMFDDIRADEPEWQNPGFVVDVEWSAGLVMARKR